MNPPTYIDYTNHRGERAWREIVPLGIRYGVTEHHPEPGWILRALAVDRDMAPRDFAMRNIHAQRDTPPEADDGD